jgi:methionine-S-sulfoxide reductase
LLLISLLFLAQTARALVSHPAIRKYRIRLQAESDETEYPAATLVGFLGEPSEQQDHLEALQSVGYKTVTLKSDGNVNSHQYTFARATGMLKLVNTPEKPFGDKLVPASFEAPRWVQVVRGFENILVQNGWSFLDPDENEKISAFNIDAANLEGLYKPKWGEASCDQDDLGSISSLGFSLRRMTPEEILQQANDLKELTRQVLLEGNTDPYDSKQTHNGYSFRGSVRQEDIEQGIFVCAVGNLPLFSTQDLTMSTVRSGWLSFLRPVSDDHVNLVHPEEGAPDQRIEVVCAKSGCHLGHYFGKGNGYCINASAMNLIPSKRKYLDEIPDVSPVVSWQTLNDNLDLPVGRLISEVLSSTTDTETIVFGAGCFWHIEYAFRRLPGVMDTQVGYAGGTTTAPTYEDVCKSETGHAEVVRVTFDRNVLDPRILIDCFLSLHDPTKVRAHGKHAEGTGQYRSCAFVITAEMQSLLDSALHECREQLNKDLCTDVRKMDPRLDNWFWPAEDRHQRHDEKRAGKNAKLETLSVVEWLKEYGKRRDTVWGSSQTLNAMSTLTSM